MFCFRTQRTSTDKEVSDTDAARSVATTGTEENWERLTVSVERLTKSFPMYVRSFPFSVNKKETASLCSLFFIICRNCIIQPSE